MNLKLNFFLQIWILYNNMTKVIFDNIKNFSSRSYIIFIKNNLYGILFSYRITSFITIMKKKKKWNRSFQTKNKIVDFLKCIHKWRKKKKSVCFNTRAERLCGLTATVVIRHWILAQTLSFGHIFLFALPK